MTGKILEQKTVRDFKFAVISDPHVAVPETIWDHPSRFHLVEISIPALDTALEHLTQLDLDFLLLPGDLTQHGEPANHEWLADRLTKLPFPAYVIPGNHDVPVAIADKKSIGLGDFPYYYREFGYQNPEQLYYTHEVLPGVRLIGLNSNEFDENGKQLGRMDQEQLQWLQGVLDRVTPDERVMVMIHHNVLEHLPGQSQHAMGQRYMLDNAPTLIEMLQNAGVQIVLTGHLHVQDIASKDGIYDITTGSLVSHPHPYRVFHYHTDRQGQHLLDLCTHQIESVPGWPQLLEVSREWMGDRSHPFMMQLLMASPLNLPKSQAEILAPTLRYFWADIACGDGSFDFPEFPPQVRRYFQAFSATGNPQNGDGAKSEQTGAMDNHGTLVLSR